MNYYQLNRDKLLKNAKNRYHNGGGKKNVAKYHQDNQEVLREKARNQYRNLSEEEEEDEPGTEILKKMKSFFCIV